MVNQYLDSITPIRVRKGANRVWQDTRCRRLPNTATKEERAAAHRAKMILKGYRR